MVEGVPPKRAMQALERQGKEVLGMLRRHFEALSSNAIPARPEVKPGDVCAHFGSAPPTAARPFADIVQDVEKTIFPALTHWQHPRFMAYYPANSSVPAILSETLIAGAGVVGLQWASSPAATELEVTVMDWLARMIGVSDGSPFLHTSGKGGGIIQNTAGEAIACVMVCARTNKHREMMFGDRTDLTEDEREATYYADSSKFVYYCSDQTHFSGPKAARVAGIRVVKIPARMSADGKNFGLQACDLAERIAADKSKGLIPVAVQLNYGTTNTSSNDPVGDFEALVKEENLWLHVDAAYAGPSWTLPEFQHRFADVERVATSFNFNGSKWFLCGFDSGFLWVNDRNALKHTFAASGAYLAPNAGDGIYDPELKDWAVPLGRRFRSLRIWMVINYFGVEGIQAHLRSSIALADGLRKKLASRPDLFEMPIETELGLVVFSLKDGCAQTQALCDTLLTKEGGEFCIYPSKLEGRTIVRAALGGVLSDANDVDAFWNACVRIAESLKGAKQ